MGKSKATSHTQGSSSGSEPAPAEDSKSARRKRKAGEAAASAKSDGKAAEKMRYLRRFANIAKVMCLNGVPLGQIADAFEVDEATINKWKRTHKDFAVAFQHGMDLANGRVRRSLYALACGYEYPDVKIFRYRGRVIYAPYEVHVPASVEAAVFWLTKHCPDEWSADPKVNPNADDSEAMARLLKWFDGTKNRTNKDS
jgi:hypothetical protein